mmetsp:Transcript_32622/g.53128  ORF Transcript_32622/g.53128 Transcript_32622/m.53128 type:complete len:215 (+) Transcript_32622:322-966(+)
MTNRTANSAPKANEALQSSTCKRCNFTPPRRPGGTSAEHWNRQYRTQTDTETQRQIRAERGQSNKSGLRCRGGGGSPGGCSVWTLCSPLDDLRTLPQARSSVPRCRGAAGTRAAQWVRCASLQFPPTPPATPRSSSGLSLGLIGGETASLQYTQTSAARQSASNCGWSSANRRRSSANRCRLGESCHQYPRAVHSGKKRRNLSLLKDSPGLYRP